jgi:hypothetical protein
MGIRTVKSSNCCRRTLKSAPAPALRRWFGFWPAKPFIEGCEQVLVLRAALPRRHQDADQRRSFSLLRAHSARLRYHAAGEAEKLSPPHADSLKSNGC